MSEKGMFDISDLEGVLARVADRLDDSFTGVFSKETIQRYVSESYELLAKNATVTVHLPSLTERFAKDRLRALAQHEAKIDKEMPSILFVCVHNAGRSQMAAALATKLSSGRVEVRSAGSAPSESIPGTVHSAMQEIGLSLEEAFPKPLTDEVVRASDVVITMGCGDACPIYPGKRYEDWTLDDPSELDLHGVKLVRDEISERISKLLSEMDII